MADSDQSTSTSGQVTIHVSFRGTTHLITVPSLDVPLQELKERIEERTGVSVGMQKLMYKSTVKGRGPGAGTSNQKPDATLKEAGMKDGTKIVLMGSMLSEVEAVRDVETEKRRAETLMRERALKPAVKLRSTTKAAVNSFRFHSIRPLAHLPQPGTAQALLTKLANDPAIVHIMHQHQFSVGLLTELAPHEHPHLLGLNENKGEVIRLRIRTDAYDGFRLYAEVRRVLCHELTHNVWGDHDENFKQLNSKLNKEVAEYERAAAHGTHYLSGAASGDIYEPSVEHVHSHVLGGSASPSQDVFSIEERRRRTLEATMRRLQKEEEEIEHSCGTGTTGW